MGFGPKENYVIVESIDCHNCGFSLTAAQLLVENNLIQPGADMTGIMTQREILDNPHRCRKCGEEWSIVYRDPTDEDMSVAKNMTPRKKD